MSDNNPANAPPMSSSNDTTRIVKAQIVFLLSTLTEDNFERNQLSIRQLSEQQGVDTYLHFIRRLIVQCQARLIPSGHNLNHDPSAVLALRLLAQETQRLARDPFLADRFRDALDLGEGEVFRTFDLARFVDRVGLRPLERLVLAAALVRAGRKELAAQAMAMVRADFDAAVMGLCQTPAFPDGVDLPLNGAAKLMGNLLTDLPSDLPILDGPQRQAVVLAAQTKYGTDAVVPLLTRIFPSLTLPAGASLIPTLAQMGPEITGSPDVVLALFLRFGISDVTPPDDMTVTELVTQLTRAALDGSMQCDAGSVIRALAALNPSLKWPALVQTLDQPDRHGVDTATLKLIIAILLSCPHTADPHAVSGLWSTWSNTLYQLRLLDALLSLPPDTFSFINLPGRRIVTVEDVSSASPTIKSLAANVQGHSWNSLDLYDVICRASASPAPDVRACVREMLDKAVKISPELVHMGLIQGNQGGAPGSAAPWSELRADYAHRLLNMFLDGHPNHQLVFMRIWQVQPSYMMNAFRDYYAAKHLNITRILDVAQDLKILDALLDVQPFTFGLDVASLASRREYLKLDKWLQDKVDRHGADFLHAVIEFLELKMESEKAARMHEPPLDSPTLPLTAIHVMQFLRLLKANADALAPADVEYSIDARTQCLQNFPRLMSVAPGALVEPGLNLISYPPEVEQEVTSLFQAMFDNSSSLPDILKMLQRQRDSTAAREQELFACTIHFLLEEYRFYPSYPPPQLIMTSRLFGQMIQRGFVDHIPLGIALRYVCDALACPPGARFFEFGVTAVTQFEKRLPEWPPVCQRLIRIPHLAEQWPEFVATLRRALAASDVASSVAARAGEPFTAIQPDPDATVPPESPPEEISDRILFVINNLAPSNFEQKVAEMRTAYEDAHARWLARYLVDQRIAAEPNNHALYLRFLDALDSRPLFAYILQETLIKASSLLNSESALGSTAERSLLNNIGVWLGTITLARDKPIKYRNLAMKDLLLEAADSARLPLAIPFVCKTLEPAAQSNVFRPPNPWIMAVLALLAELYHFAELKLMHKFHISSLCTALDVVLDAIEPSALFRNRPSAAGATGVSVGLDGGLPEFPDLEHLPVAPDFVASTGSVGQADAAGQSVVSLASSGGALAPSSPGEAQRAIDAHTEGILAAMAQSVVLNREWQVGGGPTFKRAIQLALDHAVREIIAPVVERSVTIAGISTRELVTKDFATEPSEDRLRKAAQLMSQKLAGSLALVTCKDPLRSNLPTHVSKCLEQIGITDEQVPLSFIDQIVQDNLDIACQAIEKAAMDRAMLDVDEGLLHSFESRRRYREQHAAHPYWDPSVLQTNWPSTLPDPLRLKATGVQAHQLHLYEDFAQENQRRMISRPASTAQYGRQQEFQGRGYSPAPDSYQPSGPSLAEIIEKFNYMSRDLEAIISLLPPVTLADVPSRHEIRELVRDIVILATKGDRNRVPLALSQKITQLLYKTQSPLGRELYVALLGTFCRDYEDVAKEVIPWLLESSDERKYNIPVTMVLLFKGRLISLQQQDTQLAKFLSQDPKASLQDYAAGLIEEAVYGPEAMSKVQDWANTMDMLVRLSSSGMATEEVDRLIDQIRGLRRPVAPPQPQASAVTQAIEPGPIARQATPKAESDLMREKLAIWFHQWIQIYQRAPTLEKSFVSYINGLSKQGILADENSLLFFRVCLETSVASYIKAISAGDYANEYQAIDALSKLVSYILKYHGDARGGDNTQAKVFYLKKVLSIFTLVLGHMHEERGANFPQLPFFRLFSSFMIDLHTHANEGTLSTAYQAILVAVADAYGTLQPITFPYFAWSWASLISHRHFMAKLLGLPNREGWATFHKLLLAAVKFLAPLLNAHGLLPTTIEFYQGVQRILLVLLHDHPDFLSEYYFSLADAIPVHAVQLRNIILAAFPPEAHLTEPDDAQTAAEDSKSIPIILSDYAASIRQVDLLPVIDQLLTNPAQPALLSLIMERIASRPATPLHASDSLYHTSLLNSTVLYIGVQTISQNRAKGEADFNASDAGVAIFEQLAKELEPEGRHLLMNAFVMHLRHLNAHTFWFHELVLYLFLQVKDPRWAEVTARVLFERLIPFRPHPWGVIFTFNELVRNPKYGFREQPFNKLSRDIEVLLQVVHENILNASQS